MAAIFYEVSKDEEGMRLDRLLRLKYSAAAYPFILKLIRKGDVRVNGKRVQHNARLALADTVRIPPPLQNISSKEVRTGGKVQGSESQYRTLIEQNIIFKNADFFAINKPPELAVQGGSGVALSVDGLLQYAADKEGKRPYLVHRLDKDTSGVLLLAYRRQSAVYLSEAFKNRVIKKCYLALVCGVMPKHSGVIDMAIEKKRVSGVEKMVISSGGKPSVTEYQVLDSVGESMSLVAFYPLTGRKHQIRVHSASVGCPIVGDKKYGGDAAIIADIAAQLHLHAYEVTIDPKTTIQAPLPRHFKASLAYFGLSLS